MANRVEPEIPSINLDHDQIKPSTHAQKAHSASLSQGTQHNQVKTPSKASLSAIQVILILIPYLALSGAAWYFYQYQLKVATELNNSQQRIQQLENQLSATGEEIGESTVALKVKLESIGKKTELLLTEMDKLWASAWRKNQKQIKELKSENIKLKNKQQQQLDNTSQQAKSLTAIKEQITATEFSINALSEQLTAITEVKNKMTQLSKTIATLEADSKTRDEQQILTATSINELETNIQIMIERIDAIERTLKNQGTSL